MAPMLEASTGRSGNKGCCQEEAQAWDCQKLAPCSPPSTLQITSILFLTIRVSAVRLLVSTFRLSVSAVRFRVSAVPIPVSAVRSWFWVKKTQTSIQLVDWKKFKSLIKYLISVRRPNASFLVMRNLLIFVWPQSETHHFIWSRIKC